jgi:WXXGXW repeat (2 copies)
MIKKLLIGSVLGLMLSVGVVQADVFVRVAPPRPRVERRLARPGPRYVWVPGYHIWNGTAYVWRPGVWVLPPRPHARWIRPRWVHRRRGWVFIEGRWR